MNINDIVERVIWLRRQGKSMTLLAVCPNSDAVLEATIKAAVLYRSPMLFAATLNQVDRDGGYTGMTPAAFVSRMRELAEEYSCASPLFPCLDHGGPWLKDAHTLAGLSLDETMDEVKASLDACIEAGYGLLHVDPTVDRTLPRGHSLDIDVVVGRTCELIAHAESTRARSGTQPISYEVGTEEVHGGLADEGVFERFLDGLQSGLQNCGIPDAWPCFIVAKVGTDLHTTTFDGDVARRLADRVAQLGSVIKGHYTDWVANPADYPRSGVGGANVGPEFTATELSALKDLCEMERRRLGDRVVIEGAGFEAALERAVVESERWRKWLTPEEEGSAFDELEAERREWLVATGARYVWTEPGVKSARQRLYTNVASDDFDPHTYLVDRIVASIGRYVKAFGLQDSLDVLVDGVL